MVDANLIGLLDFSEYLVVLSVLSMIVGLGLHLKFAWHARYAFCILLTLLIGLSTGLLFVAGFSLIVTLILFVAQSYRLFSVFRLIKGRPALPELRRRSFRTEVFLDFTIIMLVAVEVYIGNILTLYQTFLIISFVQFLSVLVFMWKVQDSNKKTAFTATSKHIPDVELPSITVAIPARNETSELTECLQSLLATDYQKMEIVVLDDCSQDQTSDIIKGFAHRGVRFLEGKIPKSSWLAKNYAYQQLMDESEGKYIVFCGVDVRFDKTSIRNVIETITHNNLSMLSVLPTRNGQNDLHEVIQPMRYWRELAIPRIFNKRPPTLSTFWVIERKYLIKLGGFGAFKKSIRPEKHFAKRAFTVGSYRFLRSSSGLGISSVKNYKAQWQTALRTRYPEHKKRPENIFIFSMWFVIVFISPFFITIIAFSLNFTISGVLSLLATLGLLYTHYKVDKITNGRGYTSKIILFWKLLSLIIRCGPMNLTKLCGRAVTYVYLFYGSYPKCLKYDLIIINMENLESTTSTDDLPPKTYKICILGGSALGFAGVVLRDRTEISLALEGAALILLGRSARIYHNQNLNNNQASE
jgi:glycosyltransferase involved in cell wall biosynthesis